ncbi:GNAT family N-acetyltransferase [Agrobacterium larrymoorei]|uniref:GNAT family N-acetyltransferase n=1 Tax=Agrobacterium larrymoorei TaxID=160699 RepID=UPI001573852B|nr:GNAT family N-acetyltransferase [Agrobacterium larrymoorei]NTJ43131.1 GNAT family N-acetyltransferase [Agrobacterium larrymoorei]
MRFRTATRSDATSLAAISIEVWLGTYIRKGINDFFATYALTHFTASRFEALVGSETDHIIVSQNEDGIDGFIHIAFDSPAPVQGCSTVEIAKLYVQPRHQGKGLGKGLLEEAYGVCRARACSSIWLTVNSNNPSAISFYNGQGFVHVGQTVFRIDEQAYPNEVLAKVL